MAKKRFGLRKKKHLLKNKTVELPDGTLFNPKKPGPGEFIGMWNGEKCLCRYMKIKVLDNPDSVFEHPWWKPYIGEEFDCIEVNYYKKKFYISNADGSGMYKVTKGEGSPFVGHAGFETVEMVKLVERREDWIMVYDPEVSRQIAERGDAYWMGVNPERHSEIIKMRETAAKMAKASREGRLGVDGKGGLIIKPVKGKE